VLSLMVVAFSLVQQSTQCGFTSERFAPRCAAGYRPEAVTMSTAAKSSLRLSSLRRRCVPNNRLPMLVYRGAIDPARRDPAAAIEKALCAERLGPWLVARRHLSFTHYHSQIHEVLGIAAGKARVRFGGKHGEELDSKRATSRCCRPAPASAHLATPDLLVIGAYPPDGHYDLCRGTDGACART